ncbi:MAG: hypothetical protein ACI9E1_001694 [Cryomorphaceae bacterium]|jgi:hypothetical protein
MKKSIFFLVSLLCLASCKKDNTELSSANNNSEKNEVSATNPNPKKEIVSNNTLCKINGQDWNYTKASGIVSTHARTKKRTALLTFKRKLEKGSEHIQLHYDTETSKLIAASLQLKFTKKDGKLSTCFYDIKPETRSRKPQTELMGSIDLSNPSNASGTAEIKNLNINYEKDKLKNAEDAVITVTDLKFTDIGYSDTDK